MLHMIYTLQKPQDIMTPCSNMQAFRDKVIFAGSMQTGMVSAHAGLYPDKLVMP